MLCYEINVNEQIEFHTLINSVTEEELNGNRSLWWLMNDFKDKDRSSQCRSFILSMNIKGELQVRQIASALVQG